MLTGALERITQKLARAAQRSRLSRADFEVFEPRTDPAVVADISSYIRDRVMEHLPEQVYAPPVRSVDQAMQRYAEIGGVLAVAPGGVLYETHFYPPENSFTFLSYGEKGLRMEALLLSEDPQETIERTKEFYFVFWHTHPFGSSEPSPQDERTFRRIARKMMLSKREAGNQLVDFGIYSVPDGELKIYRAWPARNSQR